MFQANYSFSKVLTDSSGSGTRFDAFLDINQPQLERARAEIAQLQAQRDGIAAELGQLSGVIEALSVPETEQRPPLPTRDPHPFAPELNPDQETPDA